MSRLAGSATAPVFGQQYQKATRVTPLGTTSASLIGFLTLTTTSLPAGSYQHQGNLILSGSASSTQIGSSLELDGAPLGFVKQQATIIDGGYLIASNLNAVLAAGVHTIELLFSKPAGSGTTTAVFAEISLLRVA